VSKGAFNRSLAQARRNVIKSIYTVFLLAYFGLFDSPKLEPFLRLGDEMKTFLDAKHETGQKGDSEAHDAMKALENALESSIGELARMGSFKRHRDAT
jgi:glycogen synthase